MDKRPVFHLLIALSLLSIFSCQKTDPDQLLLLPIFADHMVLQQEQEVPIWGEYESNEKIWVSGSWGAKILTHSDESGHWQLKLPTPSAGGPHEIKITTSDTIHVITDVMIGEVWLASGQSNMEMPLTGYLPNEPIDNHQEEIASANYPAIRMFTVQRNISRVPIDTITGQWKICSPQSAPALSATAYFFARRLYQELQIPIGIIHTSWGGTVAEAWTSKEGLSNFPNFIDVIEQYAENDNIEEWTEQFDKASRPNNLKDFESLGLGSQQIIQVDYDDSNWSNCKLPLAQTHTDQFIQNVKVKQELEGMFWYRKKFQLSEVTGNYKLYMGAIDDADITYINGQKIGSTWDWQAMRTYNIPENLLTSGENIITILHFDGAGISSIAGPIYLESNGGQYLSLEGDWNCLYYADIYDNQLVLYGLNHQEKLVNRPRITSGGPNKLPSSLYNAMLHPIIPYQIKGVIWYQGESNVSRAKEYETLFPDMIKDWRNQWGYNFPFYFVQIAPFEYGNNLSPSLRDAQRKSLRTLNTGMAITLDIGMPHNIHPGNKQDVGHRLALLALKNEYSKEVIASGPLYNGHEIIDKKIIVEFDNVGSGLRFHSTNTLGFEIASNNGIFKPALVKINGAKIELFNPDILNPTVARYGWKDYFEATLFNKEGLPASSFSTE